MTLLCFIAVLAVACKKSDDRMTANMFELKLKAASQRANKLMQEKHGKSGRIGDAMTADQTGSFMTEADAIQIVQPLIEPSAAFLQTNYNINIYNYFPAGSPKIAQIGAMAMRLNQLEMQGISIDTSNSSAWFTSQTEVGLSQANGEILTRAQGPTVNDCAIDALGIPAPLIYNSPSNWTRGAILRAVWNLATRTMSMIGVAMAVYDFGSCMNWW